MKSYVTKDPSETDELFPRAEQLADATDPIFSAFQIDGNTLYFDAYTVGADGATRIDSFAIQKQAAELPETSTDTPTQDPTTAPTTPQETEPDDTEPTVTTTTAPQEEPESQAPAGEDTTETAAGTQTAEDADNPPTGDNPSLLLAAVPVTALAALVLTQSMKRKRTRNER